MEIKTKKMVNNGGHDEPPKFLQNDKFLSKLLAKEDEKSFRLSYYGGAASAIPFMWESQPGTPKHTFSDTSLPPLTPPPSYTFTPHTKSTQNRSKSKGFQSILPRIVSKKFNTSPSYSSWSSPSLSSSSSFPSSLPSLLMNNIQFTSRSKLIPRSRSTIYIRRHGEGEDGNELQATKSPNSILCFGSRKGSRRRSKGHENYPVKNLRNAFLSIARGGTA